MRRSDVQEVNRIRLLRYLFHHDQSRVGLARRLGLSKSVVTGLISDVVRSGLVIEVGRGESREVGGKRPVILSINSAGGLFLGIHFNDSEGGVALTNLRGEILCSRPLRIDACADFRDTLSAITTVAKELLGAHPQLIEDRSIFACGVSVKGLVDSHRGVIHYVSSMPHWVGVPVGEYFSELLAVPTFVDNDARAVMCLNLFTKPDEEMDVVGCLFLEQGVGTSISIGNHVLRGAFNGAVNMGHTVVDPEGPLCRCGKRGCLEAHVSIDGLMKKARKQLKIADLAYQQLVRMYQDGVAEAREILLGDYCKWVAIAISNFINVFNPRLLTVYLDLALFDQEMLGTIKALVHQHDNQVTARSSISFSANGMVLHMKAAAALAVKNFLSLSHHKELLKGA